VNCFSELDLMRYCDGELQEPDRTRADVHLASCVRCGRIVATLKAEDATLRAVLRAPWPEPSFSEARVAAQIAVTVIAVSAVWWTIVGFDEPSVFSLVPLAIAGVVSAIEFVSYPVALLLSLALLAATTRIAIRRRLVGTVVAVLIVVSEAQPLAMVRRTGPTAVVAANEVIEDSVFAAGNAVRIDGRVNGDVFASGQRVEINGVITGRLIAMAEIVSVSGSAGSLLAFARTVQVRGEVGDWHVWGQKLDVVVNARVLGSGIAMGDSINVDGIVGGPLQAFGNRLTIGPSARIERALRARVNRAQVTPGAFVAEGHDIRAGTAARLAPEALTGRAVVVLLAFAIGCWTWRRRRRWLMVSAQGVTAWWKNLVRGGAALLFTLVISFALAVTIVGLPLAGIVLSSMALALIAALTVAATFVAEHLFPRAHAVPFLWRLLLALLTLGVMSLVGYGIGFAISVVTLLAGLGGMTGTYLRRPKAARSA